MNTEKLQTTDIYCKWTNMTFEKLAWYDIPLYEELAEDSSIH